MKCIRSSVKHGPMLCILRCFPPKTAPSIVPHLQATKKHHWWFILCTKRSGKKKFSFLSLVFHFLGRFQIFKKMQVIPKWRNVLILKNSLIQSTRIVSSTQSQNTHLSSFHSTSICFEKWKNKWNSVSFLAFSCCCTTQWNWVFFLLSLLAIS